MDRIVIKEMRQKIDEYYIGFRPQNISVKPVHIAGGTLRTLLGETYSASKVLWFSYVQTKKGKVINSDEKVYDELASDDLIDTEDVSFGELRTFRSLLQESIGADKAVFGRGMSTFTMPSKYFLTTDDLYQDAGDFVGALIAVASPKLKECAIAALNDTKDAISTLFLPVLDDENKQPIESELKKVIAYKNGALADFIEQIRSGADCLADNLGLQPNKLIRLRQINFFSIITLIRYLSILEAIYCDGRVRPLLFDCSGNKNSSVAKASVNCVININRSIARSYAWFFEQSIKRDYSKDDLMAMDTPYYEMKKGVAKPWKDKDSSDDRWKSAKTEANDLPEDKCYAVFADALFDMLALDASSHPTNYIRSLGTKSGVFYPPSNNVPNKRIVFSNEFIELLVKSCVRIGERPITMSELLARLWDRFNVVIGGLSEDTRRLGEAAITQADEEALKQNRLCFEQKLTSLSLAEIMADGLLQVRVGGIT